jgi:predicted O-linked N-acetylglucosamine transferase (SPINDLY family)
MRDRLEAAFDHWIDVQSMSDLEITKLSRELGIDIAIDLNGHTADGRTGIFAARAAPIQLNYMGFPGSMGAEYIDYMICVTPSQGEDLEALASTRQFITEKIAYVPSTFTYDRQRQLSDEPLTRAQFGLPETGFVFTCQNGCQKLMPEVFDVWMGILKAVPGSVLWLLKPNETAVKNLIKEANARGVDAERLIFTAREVVPIDQEKARIAKYLASYKLADLFLDTWPYNAGTTAVDALWAGLPVLTKTGKAMVARMATDALRAIEIPELITRTPLEYKELAIELAYNPEKLKLLKEKVQGNRLTTALFDPVGNTRHIENAYLEMYRRHQENIALEDFLLTSKK